MGGAEGGRGVELEKEMEPPFHLKLRRVCVVCVCVRACLVFKWGRRGGGRCGVRGTIKGRARRRKQEAAITCTNRPTCCCCLLRLILHINVTLFHSSWAPARSYSSGADKTRGGWAAGARHRGGRRWRGAATSSCSTGWGRAGSRRQQICRWCWTAAEGARVTLAVRRGK